MGNHLAVRSISGACITCGQSSVLLGKLQRTRAIKLYTSARTYVLEDLKNQACIVYQQGVRGKRIRPILIHVIFSLAQEVRSKTRPGLIEERKGESGCVLI